MNAQALLHNLAAQGVILSADGDRLDVDGPDSVLTDELLAMLRKRKAELLDRLAVENEEMHNSSLFDVVITYYTGERLRIPQTSTPPGWTAPF